MAYKVYVKNDSNGYITAVDSSAFLTDTTGWIQIDEGSGDKYHHAQGNYFPGSIVSAEGTYHYKLVNGVPQACTAEEIAEQEAASRDITPTVWDELDAAYQEGVDSV